MSDNKIFLNTVNNLIDTAANSASDELFDEIEKSISDNEIVFSDNHITAINNLLNSDNHISYNGGHRHISCKHLIIAAVIMISIVLTSFSVDAVRNKFGVFFVNINTHNTNFRLDEGIPPDEYYLYENKYKVNLGYIPEGFQIDNIEYTDVNYFVLYINGDKYFSVNKSIITDSHKVDTENTESKYIDVNGITAFLSFKGKVKILTWADDDNLYTIESNIDEETILDIAENLK